MKRTTAFFLSLLAAAFVCFPATAQEKPWMKYLNPSAYFQAGYSFETDFNERIDNTFYIKRARLAMWGELYKSAYFGRLEYEVEAELANSPKLVDCWLKYSIVPEFGIQFGQFKTPLSLENSECHPLDLEMIDYSLLVRRFVRMSDEDVTGISAMGREIGLQFYGDVFKLGRSFSLFRYHVGFFNGNGINRLDDDHLKDFYARVMVFPLKDLSISGYYMRRLGFMDEIHIYNDYDYRVRDRYGVAVAYDGKWGWLRSEYMAGHTDGWRGEGAYVTAGCKFTNRFSVGARCDYFTTNSRQAGHDQWYYTAGATWYPLNEHFRIQLNYTYKQEADRSVTHLVNLMTSIIL